MKTLSSIARFLTGFARMLFLALLLALPSLLGAQTQIVAGNSAVLAATGFQTAANGQSWDIVAPDGPVVADASSPQGWSASWDGESISLTVPANAIPASGYLVRMRGIRDQASELAAAHRHALESDYIMRTSAQFTVVAPPPPSAPTNLNATPGNSQVSLSWTASSGAQGYYVWMMPAGDTWEQLQPWGAPVTGTTYTVADLTNGVSYSFYVVATGPGGTSGPSNTVSATPYGVPSPPTNLTATAGNAQVSLTWTASQNATAYNVYRGTTSGGPYTKIFTGVTATSYADNAVTNGTTYYYVVTATNQFGESGYSNEVSATPTTGPPAPPNNLTASGGNAVVSLSWNASFNASGYNIYRSTTNGGPYSSLTTGVTGTSYNDASVTNGTTYYYVLTATNSYGESGYSNQASATPEAPQPPPAPTDLQAYPGISKVSLQWGASSGATSYNVLRSTTNGGPYSPVGSTANLAYVDTGLTNGVTYYYVVTASGPGGTSGNSNQAQATPEATLVPIGVVPTGTYPQDALSLPGWMEDTIPTDSSDAPGGGPASVFSVNLPFGEVDVDTAPALSYDDPDVGPISLLLHYRTALANGQYSSPGLPAGWTHNWDYRIYTTTPGSWGPLVLVYPNGQWEQITPPQINGSGQVQFTVPTGAPYMAYGVPNTSNVGTWSSITLCQNGDSQELFSMANGDSCYRLASKMLDNGSLIVLQYSSGQLTNINGYSPTGTEDCPEGIYMVYSGGLLDYASCVNGTLTYTYSASNLLSGVSNQDATGNIWQFGYTMVGAASYLSSATSYGNHTAQMTYDPLTGRATSFVDANGNVRTYQYNADTSTTVTVGSTNAPTDQWKVLPDVSTGRRLATATNAAGNQSSVRYADGTNPGAVSYLQSPTGQVVSVTYDGSGNPTEYQYPLGNYTILSWQYPSGFPKGLLTSVQDYPAGGGAPKNPTTISYYSLTGSGGFAGYPSSITYPNGETDSYTYDSFGNVATITQPTASGTTAQTTFTYLSQEPNINPEMLDRPFSITDPLNYTTHFAYDGAFRLYEVEDPLSNLTDWSMNPTGQPSYIDLPYTERLTFGYSPQGTPTTGVTTSQSGSNGYNGGPTIFQTVYDNEYGVNQIYGSQIQQVTQNLDPEYILKSLVNGNQVAMHSFSRQPSQNQETYTIGSDAAGVSYTSTYDGDGNPIGISGPTTSGTITWSSGLPSAVQLVNQEGLPPAHLYSFYTYDGFGRVLTSSTNASLGDSFEHQYSYDNEDHVTQDKVSGGLINYEIDYAYAPNGLRTSMTVSVGGLPSMVYSYSYDANGNLSTISVADGYGNALSGLGVSYTYDGNDSVLTATTGSVVTTYQYNDLGQLESLTNVGNNTNQSGSNIVRARSFSRNGALSPPAGGPPVYSAFTSLTYDLLGDLTGMNYQLLGQLNSSSANNPSGTATWEWGGPLDWDNWVMGNSTTQVAYSYDSGGNVNGARGTTYRIDTGSDELTTYPAFNGNSVQFSPDGDMTYFRNLTATYDCAQQLGTLAIGSNAASTMSYDADGHRMERTVGTEQELFVYDGDELIYHYMPGSGDGGWQRTFYVWGPTGPIQEFTSTSSAAPTSIAGFTPNTYTFDPSGNTVDRVDVYGNLLDQPEIYDGYGEPVWSTPGRVEPGYSGSVPAMNGLMFRYKGQVGYFTDTDTDLIYCHNRYYDPVSCRWITRDPTGLDGGVNTYQYCNGVPLTTADPSGLQQEPSFWVTLIPVYGSWRLGQYHFQSGHPWLGAFDYVMAASDVFIAKAAVVDGVKLGVKGLAKVGEELGEHAAERTNFEVYEVLVRAPISGSTRAAQRRAANKWLANKLKDPEWSKVFENIFEGDGSMLDNMRRGSGLTNPEGYVWHHPIDSGSFMELLLKGEHTNPLLQPVLHPGGLGGYSWWRP